MRVLLRMMILCVLMFSGISSRASHMIGGDVTYRCMGNNNFEITITLYQDCQYGEPEAILDDNPAEFAIYTGGPNPTLFMAQSRPAVATDNVPANFSNECINNYPTTCMRRQIFRFTVNLPPNPQGYYIVYQRCCRNAAINNIQTPGNIGVTYGTRIPPFASGECPNNSAVFKSLPPQIICANNPFVYDFSATDSDNDSLTYRLCEAKLGGTTFDPKPSGNNITPPPHSSVPYSAGYSAAMPLPGAPPLQINPTTGLLTGTPNIVGRFVVTVCVDEWRNGSIINTISRDVQFVVTSCSRAVVANIPELPDEPNTYAIQCKGYTVDFQNNSTGGFSYFWEFGVPGATSTEANPSFTYPDTGVYLVTLYVNKGTTCPDSISRLVKIFPEFHADFSWEGKLCPGEPIRFLDESDATYPPVVSWNWDFGDGQSSTDENPVHVYAKPGGAKEVTLTSRSVLGCRDQITKTLPLPYFNPFAGNDTIIVLGYRFNLNGTGSMFYQWSPPDYLSDPNIANPAANFPDTGTYTYILTGTNEEGCLARDTIVIQVVSTGSAFVPNAFSPNGDGINDVLMPRIVGFSEISSFQIFNRFGQQVFSATKNNYPAWDGKINGVPADIGTFYYVIRLKDADGKESKMTGDITLIR